MEKEYNIDHRLYNSLCTAVEKWFVKNKAYVALRKWEYANGLGVYSSCVTIGGKKYEADFSVDICTDTELERKRFSFLVSLTFRDVADVLDFKAKSDILNVINWYNDKCHDIFITYYLSTVKVAQTLYFYKGFVPEEAEIFRILDNFFFDKSIEELTEVIASGVFQIPDVSKLMKQVDTMAL